MQILWQIWARSGINIYIYFSERCLFLNTDSICVFYVLSILLLKLRPLREMNECRLWREINCRIGWASVRLGRLWLAAAYTHTARAGGLCCRPPLFSCVCFRKHVENGRNGIVSVRPMNRRRTTHKPAWSWASLSMPFYSVRFNPLGSKYQPIICMGILLKPAHQSPI